MTAVASLRTRLQPYLPRLTLQWLADAPEERHRCVGGSLVFADVSGFTKLSEKLAKLGRVGAEEMAAAITTCFSDLLSVAYEQGGGLLKFGGDALLLLFSEEDGDDHAARAARAAHGMRKRLQTVGKLVTPGGRVNLRMSVGVHTGVFDFFLVGESHRELVVTGPGSTRVVEMEGTAVAGEIVISPDTAAQLPAATLGEVRGQGRLLRSAPRGAGSNETWVLPELSDGMLEIGIPVATRETLEAAVGEPEHRHVSVAFIHFDGTDRMLEAKGPDVVADRLDQLVRETQRAVDTNGLCFLGSDVDADGGKLILTAGAPRAHLDDEERMLLALRSVVDAGCAVPLRIGVNKGPVFAGDIGPRYRRTYTVMGDAVNLAARVMAKAQPGQLLATGSILDASGTAFELLPLEPFMVKGKAKPVSASVVGPVTGTKVVADEDDELPLVGRTAELAVITRALDDARAGHGSTIEIVGPPGVGKTRLLGELLARADGFDVVSSSCELYNASTAYGPFRGFLRTALGIPLDAGADEAAMWLRNRVESSVPDLVPWLPLLALPLDADVPTTPEVDALGPEYRRPKLEWAVSVLLAALYAGRPVLVTLEDAHWMDDASASLLTTLLRDIGNGPWLAVVTRRDETTGFVASNEACNTLRPSPLSDDDGRTLLLAATEASPLPRHELDVLVERSGGNPLFLKELVRAARLAGDVDELPTSIEAIVTAQIDQLPPADLQILRYAAVFGASFADQLVEALFEGEESLDPGVWDRLNDLVEPHGSGRHRFRHALMRDAAYQGLPFRRRRELHRRVGALLATSATDVGDEAELLSLHFFEAQCWPEAWEYSAMAGRRSEEKFALVQSADFYLRAIEAGKHRGGIDD